MYHPRREAGHPAGPTAARGLREGGMRPSHAPSALLTANPTAQAATISRDGPKPHPGISTPSRVVPHVPRHPLARQALEERIRIELLRRADARSRPAALVHQPRGDDRRDARLVRRRLHARARCRPSRGRRRCRCRTPAARRSCGPAPACPTQVLPRIRPARSLGSGSSETTTSRGTTDVSPTRTRSLPESPSRFMTRSVSIVTSSMHSLKSTTARVGKNRGSVLRLLVVDVIAVEHAELREVERLEPGERRPRGDSARRGTRPPCTGTRR